MITSLGNVISEVLQGKNSDIEISGKKYMWDGKRLVEKPEETKKEFSKLEELIRKYLKGGLDWFYANGYLNLDYLTAISTWAECMEVDMEKVIGTFSVEEIAILDAMDNRGYSDNENAVEICRGDGGDIVCRKVPNRGVERALEVVEVCVGVDKYVPFAEVDRLVTMESYGDAWKNSYSYVYNRFKETKDTIYEEILYNMYVNNAEKYLTEETSLDGLIIVNEDNTTNRVEIYDFVEEIEK